MLGLLDVDDRHSLFSRGNVGVGARDVDVARIGKRHQRARDNSRLIQRGHVENLQPLLIDDEGVAELDVDALRIDERGGADFGGDARLQRIIEIHDNQAAVAKNVGVDAGDRDAASAVQNAAGIKCERPLEKVVFAIAVEQRADAGAFAFDIGIADHDEAFVFIRHVEERVEGMDWAFFVLRIFRARRSRATSTGWRHRPRISSSDKNAGRWEKRAP